MTELSRAYLFLLDARLASQPTRSTSSAMLSLSFADGCLITSSLWQ
jgi:hypothetical protein